MRMSLLFFLILNVSCVGVVFGQTKEFKMTIKVVDDHTNKTLQNADVFLQPCDCGGITDRDGLFSMDLPENTYKIATSFIGFEEDIRSIVLNKDLNIEVRLRERLEQLSEVIVKAKKLNDNLTSPQMGVLSLQTQDLKKIPAGLGEYDVLRSMTLLAGVNNAGEISNGLSVRGGSLDQNLLLYDYAPVFNPTHLFGLFSVFTPEVISSVDLYRANIPSRYGRQYQSLSEKICETGPNS